MPVAARIFHPEAPQDERPLETWLHAARAALARRHVAALGAAGAEDVRIVTDGTREESFGARLRRVVSDLDGFDGLVVMGSGALARATPADMRPFVEVARQHGSVLANNRYSADVVAVGGLDALQSVPDLRTDNALPRWLEEVAGYRVRDRRASWRLGVDVDSPLDLVLTGLERRLGLPVPEDVNLAPVRACLAAVGPLADDAAAEILLAGRTSPTAVRWLERRTAGRVRALVEDRGLRAGTDGEWATGAGGSPARPPQRPPASVLGALLDRDGPGSLGAIVAQLADGALLDTRVLLAHRFGRDEAGWPCAEDRFASDLLLVDRIQDPWLRSLTASAAAAAIPIVLGGHTLVGPGLRLAFRRRRGDTQDRRADAGRRS